MYDCEFTKQCMENMADIICPDKKKKKPFSKISFSHQTIARQMEETGKSIERNFRLKLII